MNLKAKKKAQPPNNREIQRKTGELLNLLESLVEGDEEIIQRNDRLYFDDDSWIGYGPWGQLWASEGKARDARFLLTRA